MLVLPWVDALDLEGVPFTRDVLGVGDGSALSVHRAVERLLGLATSGHRVGYVAQVGATGVLGSGHGSPFAHTHSGAAELARMHACGGFEELRWRVGDVVEHVDLDALELRGELAWGDIAEM